MVSPLLLTMLSFVPQTEPQETWPWPPPGAKWETVPKKAFARARREKKPVFIYIATAD